MYFKVFKPYKKTYRKGEKVYRLIVEEVCGRLVVRIAENTVNHVYETRYSHRLYRIQLRTWNDYDGNEYVERLAPRTQKGKEHLQAIAKRLVKKKIGLLTKETNEYRKLLATFS